MKLKTSFDANTQSILETRIDAVQASAKSHGGYCIWPFSQLKYPVKSLLRLQLDINGGLCEMFAAKWLAEHAKGGSIVNWIASTDADHIDGSRVLRLMQYYTVGSVMASGAESGYSGSSAIQHPKATETWLRSQGVIKRRQIIGGSLSAKKKAAPSSSPNGNASPRNFSGQIARQVVQSYGAYKLISIQGPFFAHAMAAWSDQDVSFFDPNFGEFWFGSPSKFVAWIAIFWRLAGYDTLMFGLNDCYAIQEYGLPVEKL